MIEIRLCMIECLRVVVCSFWSLSMFVFFFFFFQAEDGIRDLYVTGVQTCALPILSALAASSAKHAPVKAHWLRLLDDDSAVFPVAWINQPVILSWSQHRRNQQREIGRASCRERVEKSGGGGAIKKNEIEENKKETI